MEHYVGIDVSLEHSSVCVVDGTGKIVVEAKVVSEPEALIAWLRRQPFTLARIGLEAGPLSQWLFSPVSGTLALRRSCWKHGTCGMPSRRCR